MAQTWNDTTLPWQNTSLPYKNTSMTWNDTSLPWKHLPAATIALSASSDVDGDAQGTVIGTLSVVGGTGSYTFTLTDDAAGTVQLNGTDSSQVEVGASAPAVGTDTITVHADNGAGSTADGTFTITTYPAQLASFSCTSGATDNTPNFSAGLPATAVAGDTLLIEYNPGGTYSTYVSYVLQAADITAGSVTGTASADPVADGSYTFRGSLVRNSIGSTYKTAAVTVDTTAPTISTSGTQTVAENAAFSVSLAADESVTWTKTGGADSALFSLSGSTLSLTAKNYESPADADTNNVYVVQVTATDGAGNGTNKTINLTVTNVNEAPTVANTIADQSATVDTPFSFQFASNTFTDPDAGDTATYTATLSDGSAIPAWLSFTAATRTFSGTPAVGDIGSLTIKVTDTDSGGLTANTTFGLTVSAVAANNWQLEDASGNWQLEDGSGNWILEAA